jgi:CheY-like chemotaxis protein
MNHTLMIVEDDPDLRETVCAALEDEGMKCVGARNGADALSRLRAGFTPDLIMLDLMMPIMNGWAFREEQKKDPRLAGIPVLVLSAFPNLETALGDDCPYLLKPLDLEVLLAAIREAIGRS